MRSLCDDNRVRGHTEFMNTGLENAQKKDVGEAGHCGPTVRSDVRVSIEARQRGGIDLELESRVKPYYGDAIRRQAEEALEALGVRHARVVIHDESALPFVIAARIESAARGTRRGHSRFAEQAVDSRAFRARSHAAFATLCSRQRA